MRCLEDLDLWKLTTGHDQDTEDPLSYSDFEIVQFYDPYGYGHQRGNTGILQCQHRYLNGYDCDCEPEGHDAWVRQDMESLDDLHEFKPDESIVAYLDFQGGSSAGIRWYIKGGSCSIPGWPTLYDTDRDTPSAALVWKNGETGFWDWLEQHDDSVKLSMKLANERLDAYVKAVLDEYSMWASGDTYWVRLEKLNDEGDYDEVDSCGGFIGWDHVKDYLSDFLTEDEIKGEEWTLIETYY